MGNSHTNLLVWNLWVAQLEPNFDGIVIWWSSSKIVSGSRALPPRWLPQCSCVVIESSFDPGERLQAPGSLWLYLYKFCAIFIIIQKDLFNKYELSFYYNYSQTCPCKKVTFFLSFHSRRFHMNWTSFKRSPVLKGHFIFVSKVTS